MNTKEDSHHLQRKNKRLDLNLLIYFHTVYQTGSVKYAASVLNCSSPNVSQSLQKLRDIIGDPLFIRDGQRLSATTVAVRLYEETKDNIHELLYSVENLSKKSQKRLVIECTPYFAIKIIPMITSFFDSKGINCEIINMAHTVMESAYWERLTLKKVDIIFGVETDLDNSKIGYCVGTNTGVLVCRKDHPRLDDSYIYGSDSIESITMLYSDYSIIKKIRNVNVEFFQNSPCTLQAKSLLSICSHISVSNSIGIIPKNFYMKFKDAFNLKCLETNLQMPTFNHYMYFNKASSEKALYKELYTYLHNNYDNF